jgi:hypothetical protein
MKAGIFLIAALCGSMLWAAGQVKIDDEVFGKSLGGWNKRGKTAAEYPLSGSSYRTFKPEVTPTPEGGIFVSVRIDHVRGMLASDDHATLEVTVNSKGQIDSAQSNIAIQGRSISSDVILGTAEASQAAVGMDRAVQIGTDLVANLSAKLLREKIVESGRVTFPAVVRHNYNLLYQAIRVEPPPPLAIPVTPPSPEPAAAEEPLPDKPAEESAPQQPEPTPSQPADSPSASEPAPAATNVQLEIKPYATPTTVKPQGGQ